MFRQLISAAAVAVAFSGCASSPQVVRERDSVDSLIAASAVTATQALRELSETTGNSRVVLSMKPAAAEPRPAPVPMDVVSIAGRSGAIAVEMAPTPVVFAPSTGMVASGGLLSAPPVGLEKLITVQWTGDLEQLIAKVAKEVGWSVGDYSGLRVSPVIISISADNRSAFDVLRDIGGIAGTSADIRVSAVTRTISVRYPQR